MEIIVLQRPVDKSKVDTATMDTKRPAPNTMCKIAVWDDTRNPSLEVLVEIGTSILDDTKCQGVDNKFCIEANEKQDLCGWNTGAPLKCGGVVSGSYYQGCANASLPGLRNGVVDQQSFINDVNSSPKSSISGTRLFSSSNLIENLILYM